MKGVCQLPPAQRRELFVAAAQQLGYSVAVVEHKRIFFAETGDPYATAVPGTFRLLPDRARLEELERDYRGMREMFFEEPPAWPVLVERLRRLEDEINGKVGR